MNPALATPGFNFNNAESFLEHFNLSWFLFSLVATVLVIFLIKRIFTGRGYKNELSDYAILAGYICISCLFVGAAFLQVATDEQQEQANQNLVTAAEANYDVKLLTPEKLTVDAISDKKFTLMKTYFESPDNFGVTLKGELQAKELSNGSHRVALYVDSKTHGETKLVEYSKKNANKVAVNSKLEKTE